uniref:Putative periplasmic protein kinase (ArgK) n=1 Tax=uncultured marine thaumarchaeote KM3_86_F11 TaxID=1456322 RepID=A0A075HSM9_9ARCH|nr:putative periplasmic protein kinase (argK) [uncultured marine thaumarchaeote KM3_86_F11]
MTKLSKLYISLAINYYHMSDDFVSSILSGDRRAIAKAISMIENEDSKIGDIISQLYPKTGNAFIVGITGPPGTGKSTLINGLIENYRKLNKKIGVLAIDPSSPITGGSLLGDRLRMSTHNLDPNVYIRSMSSGNKSGGLSKYTRRSLSILDASGLDLIIVETVGAGQSEVDILKITDAVVIVLMPELGDDIQIYKAGLMEIGDIFVVNKSDLDGSDQMYTKLLSASKQKNDKWMPKVIKTASIDGSGIDDLIHSITEREEFLKDSSKHSSAIENNIKDEILSVVIDDLSKTLSEKIKNHPDFQNLVDQVLSKKIDPDQAALLIKEKLQIE